MRSSDRCEFLPGVGRSSGRKRKTSPFSFDFDSLGALGGQNFTSQIVPLGFRRWTPLTRLCDQKHGSRAPWGPSEISKFLAKLPPPYPRLVFDDAVPTSWTCSKDYYAADDGCDCDCGAYDPDCDIAGQEVLGCDSQEHTGVCTSSGTCETVDGANETQSDNSNIDYP